MIGLGLGIEEEGGVGWQCGELEFVLLIGRPGQPPAQHSPPQLMQCYTMQGSIGAV